MMKILIVFTVALILMPSLALAQAPSYTAEFLGDFFVSKMNQDARMIGTVTSEGNQRGFALSPGQALELLPLPAGMISSIALDLNDQGVIVGAVSSFYSPEFAGRATIWYPEVAGGYSVQFLGALPGQTVSRATAVNSVGDVVGYSSDGTYRYPVLFTAPGTVVNLSDTGIFDPADVNDQRFVIDSSFTIKRLDLNTMTVQDLGVPQGGYLATAGAVINESNQVAGLAILTSGDNCDRVAARYSEDLGWQIFSGCGQHNGANDMNDLGDLVMRLNVASYVRFDELGTFLIEDLIQADSGHWYVLNGFGLTINNNRQMVVGATNPTTGQSGAVLLTLANTSGVDDGQTRLPAALALHPAVPNPFNPRTAISFELPSAGHARLAVYGIDGRLVRVLVDDSRPAGQASVNWDGLDDSGRPAASGVYLARLEADQVSSVQKLVLTR